MRIIGIAVLVIGILLGIGALGMDVTVPTEFGERVVNFSLMDMRRNLLLVAGVLVVVGVVLVVAGRSRRTAAVGSDENTAVRHRAKKCPYCAEDIQSRAVVCRYCGRELPANDSAAEAEPLRRVPTPMKKAYEAWQRSYSEKDFLAFTKAAKAGLPSLPDGTTAEQLEATFPDIPVDFDAMLDS